MAMFSKGKGYKKGDLVNSGKKIILYGRLYTNYETEISNINTFVESDKGAIKSESGDVLVPSSGESSEDISRASVVSEDGIILGGDLNIIKTNFEMISPFFLALSITYGPQKRELIKRAQGKSIVHLHNSDLKGIDVKSPIIEEQEQVASLFRKLELTIALHQQKLNLLKQIRVALLHKMLPIKSESFPRLRFPDFTTEWKEFKAKDIFKSVTDKNHPDLPLLSASQERGMVLRNEIGIEIQYDKQSLSNYKRVLPKQFVIHLRSFQGGFAYSNIEGITSPAYTIIDFKEKNSNIPEYWKIVFSSHNFIKRLETVTYGIRDGRSISFKDFSSLKFAVPLEQEQEKIANLFKQFEKNLVLQEEKILNLQKIKKSLLNKMFV